MNKRKIILFQSLKIIINVHLSRIDIFGSFVSDIEIFHYSIIQKQPIKVRSGQIGVFIEIDVSLSMNSNNFALGISIIHWTWSFAFNHRKYDPGNPSEEIDFVFLINSKIFPTAAECNYKTLALRLKTQRAIFPRIFPRKYGFILNMNLSFIIEDLAY